MRVLVTAGASGVGLAIAQQFLASGAQVHICDIDRTALDAFITAHKGTGGSICDVSNEQQVKAMFDDIRDSMGGIDVLVNNAGIGGPRAAIEEIPLADWQQSFDINVTGAFLTMKQAIPGMKAQGSGCIINIVTSSAKTGLPSRTAYVASKCGLRGLTINAARELGPANIRVNSIFPGIIDNPRGRSLIGRLGEEKGISFDEALDETLAYISMRTLIQPTEVGDACVFLASDAARSISGQEISVDGNSEWEI